MSDKPTPSSITGGCLCGSIRYTISFDEKYPWPPVPATCKFLITARSFQKDQDSLFEENGSNDNSEPTAAHTNNLNLLGQCTMCRKFIGAVVPVSLTMPKSNVSPALESWPAYKEYNSMPNCYRGFCGNCGSPLTFRNKANETLEEELWVGTIDEKYLIGEMVPGSEKKTERGVEFEREPAFGKELCTPAYHICEWKDFIATTRDM